MSTVREIPYIEKVVSDYLRDNTDARIRGKVPDDTSEAWVQVTLLDVSDQGGVEHLLRCLVQFDCYASEPGDDNTGNGIPEVNALASTIRANLKDMRDATLPDAVVSEVRFIGHARVPDPHFNPERQRVVITASVWIHHG